jgi:DNA modification methylase
MHYRGGDTERHPTSVIDIPCVSNDGSGETRIHPQQKPVGLYSWLISSYSNPGDFVVDPFAGSCSMAVAASALGRRWLCVEKREDAHRGAVSRLTSLGVLGV